jgi:hypothetical protein
MSNQQASQFFLGGQMGDTASAGSQQHLRALARANRVRLARAELKRQIATSEIQASQVILECPWEAASMSISDLLMCQRRWGRARCRRLLMSLGVPENKQIGTLTDRQRGALSAMLSPQGRPGSSSHVEAGNRHAAHEVLVVA